MIAAGLLLALLSAAALNWGFFRQHGAAGSLPPLTLRRPFRSLKLLFTSPRWLAGFFVGIAGWALYIGALALAPLSLVQATSAGGIGLLALLVQRSSSTRLAPRERLGVAFAVGGLAALGLSLAGGAGGGDDGTTAAIAVWCLISAAVALAAAGPVARATVPGAGLGVAAGVLYAAGDVATKAAVPGGARLAFVPVVLACHGLAFVVLQLGFQRGGALATAGVATLCTNALPIVAGMVVFAEGVPSGSLGALRIAAFGAVVAGAAALAAPSREKRGRLTVPSGLPTLDSPVGNRRSDDGHGAGGRGRRLVRADG